MKSEPETKHILVCVAWPYANGPLHLGHIAGAYLPADIFARFHRIAGNKVLMVSGSDSHGTPITVRAEKDDVAPREVVERFHQEFLGYWDALGISFDLFTTTMTETHREVVAELFGELYDHGYLDVRESNQFYDATANRFLPDRYVEGVCPQCGYASARGDQCEQCGTTLDPEELLNPRSILSGDPPVLRATEHFFFKLSALQDELLTWLKSREGWRPHVINWAVNFVEGGLQDRAFTRDIDWGVPVPERFAWPESKRVYVWFEAVMGYLSATREWSNRSGRPDAWRDWWQGAAESYYFIGKDNIPFHTVIWPAILIAAGNLDLPTNVPANQYVTFKGAKASKSAGVGASVAEYLRSYEADALRYALAANLPETQDTDLSDDELNRRINGELVATWGNLVNRTVSLLHRFCDGVVPPAHDVTEEDATILKIVDKGFDDVADALSKVEIRRALRITREVAEETNQYLSRTEPWKSIKTDRARAEAVLYTAINAVAGLAVLFAPFLPTTSERLRAALRFGETDFASVGWRRETLKPGHRIDPLPALFSKIEEANEGR